MALILGHAEQVGDHLQRQLGRHLGDEVALAFSATESMISLVWRGSSPQLADAPRREALVHEQP